MKTKLQRLKARKRTKQKIRLIFLILLIVLMIVYLIYDQKKGSKIDKKYLISKSETIETMQETTDNVEEKPEKPETTGTVVRKTPTIEPVEKESLKVKKIVDKYITEKNLSRDNFAFFYYDLTTQEYYTYNENAYFTAASTIKVPLAMVYYDKINHGDVKLDTKLVYKPEYYEVGAGKTNLEYKAGESIPVSFLLEEMIKNSDNTATNILKNGLGGENAYRILIKQYAKDDLNDAFNSENVVSARYLLDVLKRLYEEKDNYADLITLMKNSSGGGYLKKNVTTCEIAHKYGSYDGYIHDYGIVFDDKPYLIGIFTKGLTDAEDVIADMNKEIVENN